MAKPKIDRVIPELAERALKEATHPNGVYTQYIVAHYLATGNLAPGCDARDLIAWLNENKPGWQGELKK